jgi:glycosyltransferase involved in cell wall biosynthesis
MKTLSIIIPVFNEEKTISELLDQVIGVKLPKGINKEIIVVNDGSTDQTVAILESYKNKIKFIHHTKNKGKGAAVRTGFVKARGDFLLIQDADLEYNPQDYSKLLEPLIQKIAKVVYGTRLVDYPLRLWGANKTPLPLHWISNKFLTKLTNLLYRSNLTDMETCYKLMTKEVLKAIDLKANKFDIEPEITAKILLSGHVIHEVPIKVKPRTKSEGKKIGWKDGIHAIWAIMKYRYG